MQSNSYWAWLSSVPEVTPKLYYQILRAFGEPQLFFNAVESGSALPEFLPEKAQCAVRAACSRQRMTEFMHELTAKKIRAITRLDDEYPVMLEAIEYPPPVLFVRGSLAGLSKAIGIVGTRRCTRRCADAARRIAAEMGQAGYTIVSGMARGIDAAAHLGAVDAGTPTIAVLGSGADVIYPPEHAHIYEAAVRNGAVISELPPGTQPAAGNFPVRNRIIAALSRGMLVVESAIKGGTAISASMAIGMGRDIFAMPGAPYLENSALPNMLIRNGAVAVTCARDILEYWGESKAAEETENNTAHLMQLDFTQRRIYELLMLGDHSAESISEQISGTPGEISVALTMMELSGLIKRVPGGKYGI